MRHLLLTVSLFATLAACKSGSSDPTPAPASTPQLEGKWEALSIHSVEKKPTGIVVSDMTNPIAAGSDVETITSTDFYLGTSTYVGTNRSYRRNGNVLAFFGDTLTIQELTSAKLVLRNVSRVINPPNIVVADVTYQRK